MGKPRTRDLERFSEWLYEYGLSDGTVDLYVHDVQ